MKPIKENEIEENTKVLIGFAYLEKLLEDVIITNKPKEQKQYYHLKMTGYPLIGPKRNEIYLDNKENRTEALILGFTIETIWKEL